MFHKIRSLSDKQKGFTLVEVIVVLVILAILAAIMIPAMTGWIDKANQNRLITACRTCVTAAQTLASEAYGRDGSKTPPDADSVMELAGVEGEASGISLDFASVAVNTLTYIRGEESVTYRRLPSPHYVFGDRIAGITTSVWEWAESYVPNPNRNNEYLTINYGYTNPAALTQDELATIFGDLEPEHETQYIYPLAVYDTSGKLLNIQYVTPQNPTGTNSQNRYPASAFIIDGVTYVCKSAQQTAR